MGRRTPEGANDQAIMNLVLSLGDKVDSRAAVTEDNMREWIDTLSRRPQTVKHFHEAPPKEPKPYGATMLITDGEGRRLTEYGVMSDTTWEIPQHVMFRERHVIVKKHWWSKARITSVWDPRPGVNIRITLN